PSRVRVRLADLGLAPENLRFEEPADDDVPRLADTIRAAGMLYPPLVRPGRKGEAAYMVLDGRRRRYAQLLRVERGEITPDEEIECLLVGDRAGQAAAAVVANSERAPVHLADVVVAIGKLRKARMSTPAIAAALGYDELEIKRLEALSAVHPNVLQAFRRDRLSLRQVRLFARLKDRERQAELARTALDGYFHEHQLQALVQASRITARDPRFRLVGPEAYVAAGGRFESDLFGELPDVALDPQALSTAWRSRAEAIGARLAAEGLEVRLGEERSYRAPEGLLSLPYVRVGSLPEDVRAAHDAATARAEAAAGRIAAAGDAAPSDEDLADLLLAQLEAARMRLGTGEIAAALLVPDRALGLEASFFWRPPEPQDDPAGDGTTDECCASDDDDPAASPALRTRRLPEIPPAEVQVRVAGASHALHEVRTDLATRGLIRLLADAPEAALIVLAAQLFKHLALRGHFGTEDSALAVRAERYGWAQHPPTPALDGEVRRRLEARREAFLASGLRPIPFVAGLAADDRLGLIGELVAAALDLREPRTTSLRRGARAEAAEIAALCGGHLSAHWTPDVAFLSAHTKPQLLAMLAAMGVADPKAGAQRKDELVGRVAAEAAERGWAPPSVQWAGGGDPADPPSQPAGEEPEGPETATGAADDAPEDRLRAA
ncbi:MAG TPA: ParB N-terminal domain-containing protein, partial [Alphaproteobacteria bacterium]|nr:ParB N-terminal domain-containing protein [Alphaproteobacteria bacterium]